METKRSECILHAFRRRREKIANGLDVEGKVFKKETLKLTIKNSPLSIMAMPLAEMGKGWGGQTGVGSKNNCSVLSEMPKDRYLRQISSVT